ncbi:ABC transporter substrate-binding protein [Herbiconiux moechotypicola]|uniref:Thiamine pyrimidine synthase n=1 Tax=Herbiconiux moechotypicola TaxID=637393 RepID=A0ABN3DQE6_9MICO|nr:ABC transporter substrate-binding protein [Herbiconiux moechotypicola]MCS5730401.1 ABC transporter substrate-binding protein [Herbiconiux moechotypicola]
MSPAQLLKTKPLAALAVTAASALVLAGCSSDSSATESSTPAAGSDLISAERCAENEAAGPITFLTSFAYAASVGILDVVTAKEQGLFEDLCLDVTIEPGSTNAQLVSAGTAQFAGLGSPSDVLVALDNGADISGIATYGNTVAITLMTNTDGGPASFEDFAGLTAGYKGAIPPQVSAMFLEEGVDPTTINWVSVGYDPTILPNGQVQALTGYKSNEPLALASMGYDITQWDPAEYGIESAFNTQIVNNTFAEEHPTAVEDFLRASFYAYNWINESDANLDEALGYAEALSDAGYDLEASKARWQTEVGLVEDSRPADMPLGGESVAQWTPEADMLVQFELVTAEPDVESAINTTFVDAIYDGTELIWPAP